MQVGVGQFAIGGPVVGLWRRYLEGRPVDLWVVVVDVEEGLP